MTYSNDEAGPYVAAWRRYRWRARTFWLIALGGFAAIFIATQAYVATTGRPANWLRPFGFAWIIGLTIAAVRRNIFRCPRCGRFFYIRRLFANHFAQRCLNCGLTKWAPGPDDTPIGG